MSSSALTRAFALASRWQKQNLGRSAGFDRSLAELGTTSVHAASELLGARTGRWGLERLQAHQPHPPAPAAGPERPLELEGRATRRRQRCASRFVGRGPPGVPDRGRCLGLHAEGVPRRGTRGPRGSEQPSSTKMIQNVCTALFPPGSRNRLGWDHRLCTGHLDQRQQPRHPDLSRREEQRASSGRRSDSHGALEFLFRARARLPRPGRE